MYTLRISNRFKKNFRSLSQTDRRRVGEEMQRLLESPYSGYPLVGEYEGLWCSRVGDVRVIYRINEKNKEIEFISVRARRVAYER